MFYKGHCWHHIKFMKNFIVTLVLFQIILATGCVNHSVKVSDYYPLENDSRYSFQIMGDDFVGIDNIAVRASKLGDGAEVYLFSEGGQIFGDTICDLGRGCYFIDESGLWTVSEDWCDDLADRSKSEKQLLLSMYPSVGDQFTIKKENSYPIVLLEVVGFEDVRIPAGDFAHCMKLKQSTEWRDGSVYSDYIWLAKSIGVIKRLTGPLSTNELVDFVLDVDMESEWNILRLVEQLAKESEIVEIDTVQFGTGHPGLDEKIYFSLYGNKSADGNTSTYKTISGVLDGIAESVISSQISTQYVYTITVGGKVAEIGIEEADLDIVESAMEQFFSLPHTCDCVVEDDSWHMCLPQAPKDVLPHTLAKDVESGDYKLWYSTGANSGTIVQFRIENGKVIIIKVSNWIA